jgi:hypothetical protein
MKEREFHGDYYQGKRPDQYEKSGKAFVWAFASLVVIIIVSIILNL